MAGAADNADVLEGNLVILIKEFSYGKVFRRYNTLDGRNNGTFAKITLKILRESFRNGAGMANTRISEASMMLLQWNCKK